MKQLLDWTCFTFHALINDELMRCICVPTNRIKSICPQVTSIAEHQGAVSRAEAVMLSIFWDRRKTEETNERKESHSVKSQSYQGAGTRSQHQKCSHGPPTYSTKHNVRLSWCYHLLQFRKQKFLLWFTAPRHCHVTKWTVSSHFVQQLHSCLHQQAENNTIGQILTP